MLSPPASRFDVLVFDFFWVLIFQRQHSVSWKGRAGWRECHAKCGNCKTPFTSHSTAPHLPFGTAWAQFGTRNFRTPVIFFGEPNTVFVGKASECWSCWSVRFSRWTCHWLEDARAALLPLLERAPATVRVSLTATLGACGVLLALGHPSPVDLRDATIPFRIWKLVTADFFLDTFVHIRRVYLIQLCSWIWELGKRAAMYNSNGITCWAATCQRRWVSLPCSFSLEAEKLIETLLITLSIKHLITKDKET